MSRELIYVPAMHDVGELGTDIMKIPAYLTSEIDSKEKAELIMATSHFIKLF